MKLIEDGYRMISGETNYIFGGEVNSFRKGKEPVCQFRKEELMRNREEGRRGERIWMIYYLFKIIKRFGKGRRG